MKKILLLSLILILFGITSLALFPERPKPSDHHVTQTIRPSIPLFQPIPSPSPVQSEKAPEVSKGKLVLVIDDMGMNPAMTRKLAQFSDQLTFSFLPYAPDLRHQTDLIRQRGHEVMLHMPMEAFDSREYPGPVALRTGKDEAELLKILDKSLQKVGSVRAVNNHMGSKFTSSSGDMTIFMRWVKDNGLIFLDSFTTAHSKGVEIAEDLLISHAKRDVFIDHYSDPNFIQSQFSKSISLAKSRGYSIAIAHPRPETLKHLPGFLERARAEGIQIVGLSHLVLARPELALGHPTPVKVAAAR